MTSITLHTTQPPSSEPTTRVPNPLPPLLQTPSGLALLELQGIFNLPSPDPETLLNGDNDKDQPQIFIGRVTFPDYRADALDPSSTIWMKRVFMHVGEHQRLLGEVKKLPKPVAVVRRRTVGEGGEEDEAAEELEVVEVVKFKVVFSQRPEPVTNV
ncbi:chromosome transmission fidelity protein 8 [Lasiosphaeria hispida]|uniref:Chromosome transmission fidelity protein 8 n=1 Tax=Lasiosphaeria hispida TaxID=260671 RepID=A0AAJ0H9Q3_9PEZI|nr:chromosome transmission fidelity protein 8 [Lasiosphaeria hispida]